MKFTSEDMAKMTILERRLDKLYTLQEMGEQVAPLISYTVEKISGYERKLMAAHAETAGAIL